MWKLQSGVTCLTGAIKSLKRGQLFWRFHLQNCQNTDEIDSANNNLGVESDSQANQLNQTKVLPGTTTLGGILPNILDRGVPQRFLNPNPI